MLPALNNRGDLPPGIHVASWMEIRGCFGRGSLVRERAMSRLFHLHKLAEWTGALRRCYVFGSFVTSAAEPRDIDVVLIMDASFRVEDCPRESRTLFSHPDAQARHGASVFWLRENLLSDPA